MPFKKLTNPTKREKEDRLNSVGWGGDMIDMLVPRRVVFSRQCCYFFCQSSRSVRLRLLQQLGFMGHYRTSD